MQNRIISSAVTPRLHFDHVISIIISRALAAATKVKARQRANMAQGLGSYHSLPQKTIVILGRAGAGKNTMASHIFSDSAATFHIHSSVGSRKPELMLHDKIHKLGGETVRVVIMDTDGLGTVAYNMWDVLQRIQSLQNVSAIFFLMKHGRVTKEDQKPFDHLIRGLRQHSDICYLVITGCEGKDKATRNSIIELYDNDLSTTTLCEFVGKRKIIPVGFPKIESVAAGELRSLYEQEMEEDERVLRLIIEKSFPQIMTIEEPWYRRLLSYVCTIL